MEDYDASSFIILLRYYADFLSRKNLTTEGSDIPIHKLFTRLSQAMATDSVFSYLAELILYPDSLISNKLEENNEMNILKLHTTSQDEIIDLIIKKLLTYKQEAQNESKSK